MLLKAVAAGGGPAFPAFLNSLEDTLGFGSIGVPLTLCVSGDVMSCAMRMELVMATETQAQRLRSEHGIGVVAGELSSYEAVKFFVVVVLFLFSRACNGTLGVANI